MVVDMPASEDTHTEGPAAGGTSLYLGGESFFFLGVILLAWSLVGVQSSDIDNEGGRVGGTVPRELLGRVVAAPPRADEEEVVGGLGIAEDTTLADDVAERCCDIRLYRVMM